MQSNNNNTPALRKPTDFDDLFVGRFLKAGQFGEKKVSLTISDVNVEKLAGDDGKEKTKGIVSFKETGLGLVLNKTNATCIREMLGRELSKWVGHKITLFASEWNGEPCIRVWGSPELHADKRIEVRLPKRKPIMMTLHAVRPAGVKAAPKAQPARDPEPPPETKFDPETGVVDEMDPEPSDDTTF